MGYYSHSQSSYMHFHRQSKRKMDAKFGGRGRAEASLPLFETRAAAGWRRAALKVLFLTIVASMVLMWAHRLLHLPDPQASGHGTYYSWILMFFAEVSFGLFWIVALSVRWIVVYRCPFKDRLSARHEGKFPLVDIFVCTADPVLEPPNMVISTVLSLMSYNYPPEKLSVYLSDDGGSELTFYALFESAKFSKFWVPFCRKYNVEPRSPQVYFLQSPESDESSFIKEWTDIKELYEDMKSRIDSVAAKGFVPEKIRDQHKGFLEWNSKVTKQDHQSIVQVLIDGWNPEAVDIERNRLPTLIYVSREKRPGCPHNFKAGAMNALIRVSEEISNAPIILNVDCDMHANDPDAVQDALCFFLDDKDGQQTSYVQHPQTYYNTVKDDVYANENLAINGIELRGLDSHSGALYVGTGCFHRRESLFGKKYTGSHRIECHSIKDIIKGRTVEQLQNTSKVLADCSYEKGTLWGKEMGLVYGCPVEDIVTGLTIQCRGWRPVYFYPSKPGFRGIGPTTLEVSLIQFKRWSEGMFQVFFSKYCPFIYGHGKQKLGAQLGYCNYLLWAAISLPTLCHAIIPAISLLHGIPLYPKVSSLWLLPYAYFFIMKSACTLAEELMLNGTVKGWWNLQRMILIRRTTAFFFACFDTIIMQLGLSQMSFVLTAKVVEDKGARKRYEKGIIDFGSPSIMLTIITMLALLNAFGLGWGIKIAMVSGPDEVVKFIAQLGICGTIALLNLPVYEAALFRRDDGSIPISVMLKSMAIASVAGLILIRKN